MLPNSTTNASLAAATILAEPPPALPVLSVNLNTQAVRQPVITQVTASPNANRPITAGGDIALNGRGLTAP